MRIFATGILLTVVACGAGAGCGTIDPGPQLQQPATCNAPPAFFVTDIWPKFFVAYGCGKSDCHDAATGHGFFRLQNVDGVAAPDPNSPVSTWPMQWQQNFQEVTTNLTCASPSNSPVLTVPSGLGQPHPPGTVVTDVPGATALFQMWLGKP